MVFDTKTGVVQAIVSFEEGGTQGYIDYTSETSGTYDVSEDIDTSIIKGGETLFGKEGTMPNNGAIRHYIDAVNDDDYNIPEGYHDGFGVVSVSIEGNDPVVTPNKVLQIIEGGSTANGRKLLRKVIVDKIPDYYIDASDMSVFGNATAADVRKGKRFTSADGVNEEGEMPTIALPEATIHFDADSGRILSVVTNNEDGFVEKGETSAITYLRTKKAAVIEPSNTTQIAVQKNYWTTGDVTVAPIPDKYKDTTGANALPGQVLEGAYFLGADGVVEEGTIRNARFAGYERKVYLDDDDPTGNTFWVNVSQNYTEGYVERAGRFVADVYTKLEIDGNKVTMECLGAKIERTVGSSIKTCKLTVTRSTTTGQTMTTATTFDGTNFVPVTLRSYSGTDTIENVVCGSVVHIQTIYMTSLYGWTYGKDEMGYGGAINIPYETGDYTVEIGALDD